MGIQILQKVASYIIMTLIYVCMKCVLKKLNITLNGIAQIQKCCEADEIGFESFKNGVLQQ